MSYRYFENRTCPYYPCHSAEHINCLFCFCPLYLTDCGGNYRMIKGKGGKMVKDCSHCLLPHTEKGYDLVLRKLEEWTEKISAEKVVSDS